jgi:hypothetical protein
VFAHAAYTARCACVQLNWHTKIQTKFPSRLDIRLAVHHSITFLLLPTWYTNFLFIHINHIKLNFSTCFERNPLIIRRSTMQIVHMQPLVSSLSAGDSHKTVTCRQWRYQRLHMYNLHRWPPDDEWIALETCRGI